MNASRRDRDDRDEPDFSDEERRAIRRMRTEWERQKWLWGLVGKSSALIGGILAAMITFKEVIKRALGY